MLRYFVCTVILLLLLLIRYNDTEHMSNHSSHEIEIKKFFKGYPKKGYYVECLKRTKQTCQDFLFQNYNSCDQIVIFDFDDTLVYRNNVPSDLYYDKTHKRYFVCYPFIQEMLDTLRYAKSLGYYIVFITARSSEMYLDTLSNCHRYYVYPDCVFMRPIECKCEFQTKFKVHLRQKIKRFPNFQTLKVFNNNTDAVLKTNFDDYLDITMTIGDQWEDVAGVSGTIGIKLPSIYDMNSYIRINNHEYRI